MKPLQVLVVEDNRGDILLIREALKLHGIHHEFHLVSDGALALNFLQTMGEPQGIPYPDVFLLDLNLPKIDGPEILKELRRHPECSLTPVIVVSSSDSPRDREKMASMDVARYFKKPSDFDEFMTLGRMILEVVHDAS